MKRLFPLVLLLSLAAACKKDRDEGPVYDKPVYTAFPGQVFLDATHTNDGHVVLLGSEIFVPVVTKIAENGDRAWSLKVSASRYISSIAAASDNGIVISGSNNSIDSTLFIKLDRSGSQLWRNAYPLIYGGFVEGMTATKEGDFLVYGSTYPAAVPNIFLAKLDKDGNIVWTRLYGSPAKQYPTHVLETADGGFLVTARTRASSGYTDQVYLMATGKDGEKRWDYTLNDAGESDSWYPYSSVLCSDGSIATCGASGSKIFVMKTGATGYELWHRVYDMPGTRWGSAMSIVENIDGNLTVAGGISPEKGADQCLLLTLYRNGEEAFQQLLPGKGYTGRKLLKAPNGDNLLIADNNEGFTPGIPRPDTMFFTHMDINGNYK